MFPTFRGLEEVEQILAEPDVNTPLGLRDRAILETLYSSGIRRTELCRLRLEQIDVDRRAIFISKGKGQKDRPQEENERVYCEAWSRAERYSEYVAVRGEK